MCAIFLKIVSNGFFPDDFFANGLAFPQLFAKRVLLAFVTFVAKQRAISICIRLFLIKFVIESQRRDTPTVKYQLQIILLFEKTQNVEW